MAAVNPQPLQARPFEEEHAIPVDEDDVDEYEDGGVGGGDGDAMEELEEANVNSVSAGARANHAAVAMPSRTSELTLSFEGEVYVFPAVTPQKVNLAILAILHFWMKTSHNFFFLGCF